MLVSTKVEENEHKHGRPVITGQESSRTRQSGGMALVTGVGPQHTSATRLWFGKASNTPASDRYRTLILLEINSR